MFSLKILLTGLIGSHISYHGMNFCRSNKDSIIEKAVNNKYPNQTGHINIKKDL
jgi:hypothetical protein